MGPSSGSLVLAFATGFVTACFFDLAERRRRGKGKKDVPRVPGSLLEVIAAVQDSKVHEFFLKANRKYGDIVCLPMTLWTPMYLNFSTEFMKVLQKGDPSINVPAADRPRWMFAVFEWAQNGYPSMFTNRLDGKGCPIASRHIRKGVFPSFSMSNIQKKLPLLQTTLHRLQKELDSSATIGSVVDMEHLSMYFTIDFICLGMLGRDVEALKEGHTEGKQLVQDIKLILDEVVNKQLANPIRAYAIWDPKWRRAKRAVKRVMSWCKSCLVQYKEEFPSAEQQSQDTSILGHLVRIPFPREENIYAEILDYLIAGTDTTAHSCSWFLYNLCQHPEIRAQVQKELDEANPLRETWDLAMLKNTPLFDRCLKESMRARPTVPKGFIKELDVDTPVGEYILPRGSVVWSIFTGAFQRQDKLHEPDLFNPDRWAPDSPELPWLQDNILPFGLGMRSCIGYNLANLELKL